MMKKNYEELTFSDDFMFCKILQNDPGLCRELLELVLGRPTGELVTVNRQQAIEITPDGRGVRFDVYAEDDRSVMYDVEMQNAQRDHLPKRTRYAQVLMDLDMLERGAHFSELRRSYVIYICQFNLWEDCGRHKYSFRNLCAEDPQVELGDETEKIFLCTEGTAADISTEMEQFLSFVTGKAAEGRFAGRLRDAVEKAKLNPVWRREYMDLRDYMDIAREEGRAEGREEERINTEREKVRADQATARADAAEAELARLRAELAEKDRMNDRSHKRDRSVLRNNE